MPVKYVLSLDGGGSHLLIQLSILACLEEDTGISSYDLFDMMAGSSSGGLITCLIMGRRMRAKDIIQCIERDRLLVRIMTENWLSRLLNKLQIRPKYQGKPKTLAIQQELGTLRLSSLQKRILIPCFNLNRDQLEVFTNDSQPDFLLSEIADACTAAPSFYPPVQMEDGDWRIDGGVGMNNPGLYSYLHAKQYWHDREIKILSLGSGWRSFAINGIKARKYGGLQWSVQGIASIILREKMMANARMTDEMLGNHLLYINHYLKNFDMPDSMDSANNPVLLRKALDIGKQWYANQRQQIEQWLNN